MEIVKTSLEGVYIIENKLFLDDRGIFIKTYHDGFLKKNGLAFEVKESFYSVSKRNVLRGMHFQSPPYSHKKHVFVTHGKIMDVVVDIRRNSPSFGYYNAVILSSDNAKSIFIDDGYAHGFLTLSKTATVHYNTTTVHQPNYDKGVLWNSFGFNWGLENEPILSERDKTHPDLKNLYR